VVVNDGSTDDTASRIGGLHQPNIRLLNHSQNQGKGAALLTGFHEILKANPDVIATVTLDADGQHDPAEIPRFTELHREQSIDLIYGNRMREAAVIPVHRRALNSLSNSIMSRICGRPILDSQCGFRLYSRSLLEALIGQLNGKRYELETEILIKACKKGMAVAPLPIHTIYTKESTKLSHHGLGDVLRIARLLAANFFG